MRDTKVIENFIKKNLKEIKELSLFRHLKKEVETGANGTQDYVIKEGQNKGKKANVK
jgi:DNA-binding sugar fermentation-stimulating protein